MAQSAVILNKVVRSHMISLISKAAVQSFFSALDFHSSLNLVAALISQTLILFGSRKANTVVMIIKSYTSGFSGGGRRELTGLLYQFLEIQASTSVADHPFANELT